MILLLIVEIVQGSPAPSETSDICTTEPMEQIPHKMK